MANAQPPATAASSEPDNAPVDDRMRGKAAYGWRGFAFEIAVVVIGVLLALGAQEVAEALRWREDVRVGEAALREDARDLIDSAAQRQAQSACLKRRLDAIADVLDGAAATGRLPAVGQLGSPSVRPWSRSVWANLVATQVPTHMPRQKMLAYAAIDRLAARLAAANDDEQQAWIDLYTIVGPGRAFGDAEQAATRAALGRAVMRAKAQFLYAASITQAVVQSGLLGAAEVRAIRLRAAVQYRGDARDGIMCKPLDRAPPAARYGQAPSPVDLLTPFQP